MTPDRFVHAAQIVGALALYLGVCLACGALLAVLTADAHDVVRRDDAVHPLDKKLMGRLGQRAPEFGSGREIPPRPFLKPSSFRSQPEDA